jgi:hypothetical protein
MKRKLFIVGLVTLLVSCTLLIPRAHAEAQARESAVLACLDPDGDIYALGVACIAGSGGCTPIGCPDY